ncbi:McrB family protein [Pelistega sp. MC2]|uniref:McrB family protein n=1 Tax=Pelistega sp. MC2 TaxID=1720297 RepID=UPI0008DAC02E|nr:AAA family ATPase [Pelistega sp. MC2]
MTNTLYSYTDLIQRSNSELLSLLKEAWELPPDKPFEIIGCLSTHAISINNDKDASFYVLHDLRHPKTGEPLLYPIDANSLPNKIRKHYRGIWHIVYLGNNQSTFLTDFNELSKEKSVWLKAIVRLSPPHEREKHANPFALEVVPETLQQLIRLPNDFKIQNFSHEIENNQFLDEWVVSIITEKNTQQIQEQITHIQKNLQDLSQEKESLTLDNANLNDKVSNKKNQLTDLENHIKQQQNSLKELEEHYIEQEQFFNQKLLTLQKNLEQELKKLNQFIESKAKLLLDLELIEQDTVNEILGIVPETVQQIGHNHADVFDKNPIRTVQYIQAYLYNKNIIYRQDVLADYYALITTHDLIVLAGDSGSGKTNLVKSFAEAVGGKAIIIPVKPNWTSAEDLLGYYNPIEKKYQSSPFLEAIFEASVNPTIPYFICLDEMNLARVEYYFADFLSLMEERKQLPTLSLYSETEASDVIKEAQNFLALVEETKQSFPNKELTSFLDLLKDEESNQKLHDLCGFKEGDSLLKYHTNLRKLMNSYFRTRAKIELPSNVRIIGAINVDDTTHYLSPKILDRAHIMRFSSPLLTDWDSIETEINNFSIDISSPVLIKPEDLGTRKDYPAFDNEQPLVQQLIFIVRNYLDPLGIEFGLRTVRQALQYQESLSVFNYSPQHLLNNIVLHKILPKLVFDGEKTVGNTEQKRKDVLLQFRNYLAEELDTLAVEDAQLDALKELDRVIANAEVNDWVVNYWSR